MYNERNFMKIGTIALVFFCAISAFGNPKVGDKVHFKGSHAYHWWADDVDPVWVVMTYDKEIVGYDANTQKFDVQTTIVIGTEAPAITHEYLASSEIVSHEQVQNTLAHCQEQNGTPGNVNFFGHAYDFCMISIEDDNSIDEKVVADVPFGAITIDWAKRSEDNYSGLPSRADDGGEFSYAWGN
jgi:hypothetical protein